MTFRSGFISTPIIDASMNTLFQKAVSSYLDKSSFHSGIRNSIWWAHFNQLPFLLEENLLRIHESHNDSIIILNLSIKQTGPIHEQRGLGCTNYILGLARVSGQAFVCPISPSPSSTYTLMSSPTWCALKSNPSHGRASPFLFAD